MAKIVSFGEYQNKKSQEDFDIKLQQAIEEVEEKLGLEDDPLLVLTDTNALTVGNYLIDTKGYMQKVKEQADYAIKSIDKIMEILDFEESEVFPIDRL